MPLGRWHQIHDLSPRLSPLVWPPTKLTIQLTVKLHNLLNHIYLSDTQLPSHLTHLAGMLTLLYAVLQYIILLA